MSFQNPTAFVTGSSGFVGREMVRTLEIRGYKVYTCDIRDKENSEDMLDVLPRVDHKFDLVVHCAYLVGGRQTIEGIPMALPYNLSLDAALFQWALNTEQERVLYFSSSAAYPIKYQMPDEWSVPMKLEAEMNGGFVPLQESYIELDNAEEPDANYGWAKLTGERIAMSAMQSGLRVHVVRPFSGYGHDQDDTYPFRALLERAKRRANPYEVWGTGEQIRDWIHISDVVRGALTVVDAGEYLPVNLCTGRGLSIRQVAEMMCGEMGYQPAFQPVIGAPTGVHARVGDPHFFKQLYTPEIDMEKAITTALRFTPARS